MFFSQNGCTVSGVMGNGVNAGQIVFYQNNRTVPDLSTDHLKRDEKQCKQQSKCFFLNQMVVLSRICQPTISLERERERERDKKQCK